jgi:hypothetical protein
MYLYIYNERKKTRRKLHVYAKYTKSQIKIILNYFYFRAYLTVFQLASKYICNSKELVRERTILTERPPIIVEISANFCG